MLKCLRAHSEEWLALETKILPFTYKRHVTYESYYSLLNTHNGSYTLANTRYTLTYTLILHITGSPDATDWDNILSQPNIIADYNNKQYTINEYLIKTTNNKLDDYNRIITKVNTNDTTKFAQTLINPLGLVKDEVAQIVSTCEEWYSAFLDIEQS